MGNIDTKNAKIKTVLFDLDGTLMDTTGVIIDSWQAVYNHVTGADGDVEVILGTFGTILGESLVAAFPGWDEAELVDIYRSYQAEHFEEAVELFPGISEMLDELTRKGAHIGLVTSRMGSTTKRALDIFGIEKYFECIISADDCSRHKPDPEPIELALAAMQADRDQAIMIGDTLHDMDCAANAGVDFAMVRWAVSIDIDALPDYSKPAMIIDEPKDVVELVVGC